MGYESTENGIIKDWGMDSDSIENGILKVWRMGSCMWLYDDVVF